MSILIGISERRRDAGYVTVTVGGFPTGRGHWVVITTKGSSTMTAGGNTKGRRIRPRARMASTPLPTASPSIEKPVESIRGEDSTPTTQHVPWQREEVSSFIPVPRRNLLDVSIEYDAYRREYRTQIRQNRAMRYTLGSPEGGFTYYDSPIMTYTWVICTEELLVDNNLTDSLIMAQVPSIKEAVAAFSPYMRDIETAYIICTNLVAIYYSGNARGIHDDISDRILAGALMREVLDMSTPGIADAIASLLGR